MMKRFGLILMAGCLALAGSTVTTQAAGYTPGVQHNHTHDSGDLPDEAYPYSVWVPKDYKTDRAYPVVVYLHGGGRGRFHPDEGKRNMVAERLVDNQSWTDAGYSGNAQGLYQYLHVAPVKPIARWESPRFERTLDHLKKQVNVDSNRLYVTGFSMGGQGSWLVAGGGSRIAAMMPLGAWGCDEVPRGETPETCRTTRTPTWVLHCPDDDVSRISEQIPLFQHHLDGGGYGRFTMIPGEGHLSRPPGNDKDAFTMRMAWMLSQTYDTPFNYVVQIKGGVILEVESGERGLIGDTCRYGFFEPGTVIRLTAPETRNGQPFIRWASLRGQFAEARSRRTIYTVGNGDAELTAIYGTRPVQLRVEGGRAIPAQPKPGDRVTIVALTDRTDQKFFYWNNDQSIDLPHPHQPTVTFSMPAQDVTFTARFQSTD